MFSECMYMPTDEKLQASAQAIMNDNNTFAYGCRINNVITGVAVFHKESDKVAELKESQHPQNTENLASEKL